MPHPQDTMCANFQAKPKNLVKNWFMVWNSENEYWNKNQYPRDTMCANFQAKQTTLTFLARFCPKVNLELEIQKTNIGITISILEIPCVKQNKQLWLFEPKFAQKWIVGVWIWKHKYVVSQFSVKMDSFEFFGLKLRKLPNYVWYFGSNIVEGVAESWVETEMSWVEVNGAG